MASTEQIDEREFSPINPAPNCCASCSKELTCGYSRLAMSKLRHPYWSYRPCTLGLRSNGLPFFEARQSA